MISSAIILDCDDEVHYEAVVGSRLGDLLSDDDDSEMEDPEMQNPEMEFQFDANDPSIEPIGVFQGEPVSKHVVEPLLSEEPFYSDEPEGLSPQLSLLMLLMFKAKWALSKVIQLLFNISLSSRPVCLPYYSSSSAIFHPLQQQHFDRSCKPFKRS